MKLGRDMADIRITRMDHKDKPHSRLAGKFQAAIETWAPGAGGAGGPPSRVSDGTGRARIIEALAS
jgi:hypothetical protein